MVPNVPSESVTKSRGLPEWSRAEVLVACPEPSLRRVTISAALSLGSIRPLLLPLLSLTVNPANRS